MFSDQFYVKRLSVRERNTKLLLITMTYIAIKESHLHNCNRHSHVHNAVQKIPLKQLQQRLPSAIKITIKIVTHIFAAETVTWIYVLQKPLTA